MPLKLSLLAVAAAAFQLIGASPTPQVRAPHQLFSILSKRNASLQITFPLAGDITLCTGYNLTGSCTVMDYEHDTCTEFPVGYRNDVSSLSVLEGWSCTLYL